VAATAAGASDSQPVETMRQLPDADQPDSSLTMRRLPEGAAAAAPTSWTVRPGEHFWAVAERVLADTWQRAPSDGEIVPYWRSLIDANRQSLHDPDNPDLLFPGQVLVVPPPPGRPG
jgi:nucleoid-associated protein YgaU